MVHKDNYDGLSETKICYVEHITIATLETIYFASGAEPMTFCSVDESLEIKESVCILYGKSPIFDSNTSLVNFHRLSPRTVFCA